MQGKKQFTDQVVTHFRLSERVPPHNLYRRLEQILDLQFLYQETQALYSHTGQPSLDPVVFFKFVLVGYLEKSPVTAAYSSTVRCGSTYGGSWATN
jgi:transposase